LGGRSGFFSSVDESSEGELKEEEEEDENGEMDGDGEMRWIGREMEEILAVAEVAALLEKRL
jgi:hypothetical protein